MGTIRRGPVVFSFPRFLRSEGKMVTPLQLQCSSCSKPYLSLRGLQDPQMLIKKRKFFPHIPSACPSSFFVIPTPDARLVGMRTFPHLSFGIVIGFLFSQTAPTIVGNRQLSFNVWDFRSSRRTVWMRQRPLRLLICLWSHHLFPSSK